jgi:hypothetical protein
MILIGAAVAIAATVSPVQGQTTRPFDVGVQLALAHIDPFDTTDAGVAVRATIRPAAMLGVETEFTVYPRDIPHGLPLSRSRVEGVFGVTVGPQLRRWRPFASFRPGFLRVAEAPQPVACILIFPPPLSCTLAGGDTLFTMNAGGGVELNVTARTYLRVGVGDRMVRYPGPTLSSNGDVHDDSFLGHAVRWSLGAGWRF